MGLSERSCNAIRNSGNAIHSAQRPAAERSSGRAPSEHIADTAVRPAPPRHRALVWHHARRLSEARRGSRGRKVLLVSLYPRPRRIVHSPSHLVHDPATSQPPFIIRLSNPRHPPPSAPSASRRPCPLVVPGLACCPVVQPRRDGEWEGCSWQLGDPTHTLLFLTPFAVAVDRETSGPLSAASATLYILFPQSTFR